MESLKNIPFLLNLPPKVKENLKFFSFVRKAWPEVLKDRADLAVPLYFEEGVLFVGVANHYELQNIASLHGEIFQSLKNLYPPEEKFPLKVIKFLYRPIFSKKESSENSNKKSFPYSKAQWEEIEALCQNVSDRELGKLLLRLVKSYQKIIHSL